MKIAPRTTADADRLARHLADLVVGDRVLAALPDEDRMSVPDHFARATNEVVDDAVVLVDVFRTRTVAAQQNAHVADAVDQVVLDRDALRVQIQSYCGIPGIDEAT